jgi:hypothetical protein
VSRFIAFIKYGDEGLLSEVRHLDNNKLNSCWQNIVIGTHSDNLFDIPKCDRIAHAKKAAISIRKLSLKEVNSLRKDNLSGISYGQLASKYGISKSTAFYIANHVYYK